MKRFMGLVTKAEEILLCFSILEMSLLTFAQVLARYGFGTSITWAEELLRYQICLVAFFGADIGLRHGSHIKAEILSLFVPIRFKHLLSSLGFAAIFVFCSVFAYYGALLVLRVAGSGQTTAAIQLPKFYTYLPIPIGGAIMCIRAIQGAAGELRQLLLALKKQQ